MTFSDISLNNQFKLNLRYLDSTNPTQITTKQQTIKLFISIICLVNLL